MKMHYAFLPSNHSNNDSVPLKAFMPPIPAEPEELVSLLPWWMSSAAVLILFGLLGAAALLVCIKVKITSKKYRMKQELENVKANNKAAIIEVLSLKDSAAKGKTQGTLIGKTQKTLISSPTSENVRQRRNSLSPLQNTPNHKPPAIDVVRSPAITGTFVRSPPKLAEEGVAEHEVAQYAVPGEARKKRRASGNNKDRRVSPEPKQYRSRPPKGQKEKTPGRTLRKVKSDPYHIREPLYLGPIELRKAVSSAKLPKACEGQSLSKALSAPSIGSAAKHAVMSSRELPRLEDSVVYDSPAKQRFDDRELPSRKAKKTSSDDVDDPLRSGFKGRITRKLQEEARPTTAENSKDLSANTKRQKKAQGSGDGGSSKSFANPFYDSFEVCEKFRRERGKAKDDPSLYGPGVAQVLEERPVYVENVDSIYENVDAISHVSTVGHVNTVSHVSTVGHVGENVYDEVDTQPMSTYDEVKVKKTKRRRRSSNTNRKGPSTKGEEAVDEYAKVQKNRKRSTRPKERDDSVDSCVSSSKGGGYDGDSEGNLYDSVEVWKGEAGVASTASSSSSYRQQLPRLKSYTSDYRQDESHVECNTSDTYEEVNETVS